MAVAALRQEAAPTAAEVIETLMTARARPDAALRAAVGLASEIAPAIIAVVEETADGRDLSREQGNLLFWGIHVLGSARRTELCQPLMRLFRQRSEDDLRRLLGGARTESLAKIIISVFDGDSGALFEACADSRVDSMVRWCLIGALARLTFDGTVARDTMLAFLDRFEREPLAASDDDAWQGWQDAIYLLGLEEMRERLHAACRDGRFVQPEGELEFCDQRLTIACNLAPGDPSLFDQANYRPLGDPVKELQWVRDADTEEEDEERESDPASAITLIQDEIDWLGAVLARVHLASGTLTVEQLDGLFCAFAIHPDRSQARALVNEFLAATRDRSIFGNEQEAERARHLMARMWNTIVARLDAHRVHRPILQVSDAPKAQRWAKGFIGGMEDDEPTWDEAIRQAEARMFFAPILGLALEDGEQHESFHATPEARAEWLILLPSSTIGLYAAMRFNRRYQPQQPVRSMKVGRNEPCPCGSGKKYKRCCGSTVNSLH